MESKAVFESHFDIVDLWTQEAIEADKLIIILKSSCHFSNISENVHHESTIRKWLALYQAVAADGKNIH